jgi:hypothetical protein
LFDHSCILTRRVVGAISKHKDNGHKDKAYLQRAAIHPSWPIRKKTPVPTESLNH